MRDELSINEEQNNIEFSSCPHSNKELRYKIDSRNRRYYIFQCLNCGKSIDRVKNSRATGTESLFDEALLKRCQQEYMDKVLLLSEQRMEQIRLQNQKEKEEQAKQYKLYLESPQWKLKREIVLERDKHLCQSCLEHRATQVHHLTYNHIFNEPLFELVAVCGPCHIAITEMDHASKRW